MDYEPVNQSVNSPANPPMNQTTMEPMEQSSLHNVWYIAGAIVVIAALGLWYYSSLSPAADMSSQTVGTETQTVSPAQQVTSLSSGNSVEDISADLTQTSDGSAELSQAAAASVQDIQGF